MSDRSVPTIPTELKEQLTALITKIDKVVAAQLGEPRSSKEILTHYCCVYVVSEFNDDGTSSDSVNLISGPRPLALWEELGLLRSGEIHIERDLVEDE